MAFQSIDTIIDFLEPVNKYVISDDQDFKQTQLGAHIQAFEKSFPNISNADFVILGCSESRGASAGKIFPGAPDKVRREFYSLFHWHKDVVIADVGNIKPGATLQDSYAALRTVVSELLLHCKRVLILGGGHDLTIAQHNVYAAADKIIQATIVDAKIDMNMDSVMAADNFVMPLLTDDPNFVSHYNHIGFQSFFIHPQMLETIDKLRFDCFRVGKVKENMEEMEPVIRNTHLFSLDISAIQHAHAPANRITPNGFTGEEICMLMQYAGMSPNVSTVGIYGFMPEMDVHDLTAKQISHMLWYFMDGIYKGRQEPPLSDTVNFNEFKLAFAEVETTFLQSKKTGRWWVQLPQGNYIPCSHADYVSASKNEIPERWLRAVERG